MNLTVTNLSNVLAKNNCVYLSPSLAKDPNSTVHVRIQGKVLKCGFNGDVEETSIGMSKNIRQFLDTDIKKAVRVEPLNEEYADQNTLSFLECQLTQVSPKLTGRVKIEDYPIIQALRTKEKGSFFNLGQSKYITHENIIFSLRVVKCMNMLTGSVQQQSHQLGKLLPETQVALKVPEGSLIALQTTEQNQKNIFRPDFTVEDMGIGGLDDELFNIFRRTFASRRFSTTTIERFGIKHVKGILLYGPPGTGKTLIARQLAKALNVNDLKIVNGPEIFSKFAGQSEQNIRKLFAEARKDEQRLGDKSPLHIIVFDEIDAICKQRGVHGGVGGQVSDQVVNQLLTNIDGVEALNNIVVIGMTNRKDLLDEAILRPGRFQVHVEVKLPNQEGRQQILRIHTKNLRQNKLLHPECRLEEIARLTRNFTGAQLEALVKCASSHSISRTTNILQFSKELEIDEKRLGVEMQDFLKALQEVKPQFGVDEQKFSSYGRSGIINYGPTYDRVMNTLQETATMGDRSSGQKRSVLLQGPPGSGKTTLAMAFARHTVFSYLKIISAEQLVGMGEQQRIHKINKIFQDAYKTTNACIVIDDLERVVGYSPIGRRFNNSILQALLLLLERNPPNDTCRLLLIATTSCHYHMRQLELPQRFDIKVDVGSLTQEDVTNLLQEQHQVPSSTAKAVAKLLNNCTIQQLLELTQLVEDKQQYQEWEFYWNNLLNPPPPPQQDPA